MTTIQGLSLAAFAVILLYLAKRLPFTELMADKKRQHIVFGATASLFFLWIFRAGIFPGLNVHFLWLSALTLTLGFRWAVFAATAALLGTTAIGKEQWEMLGVNGLLGVLAPISVSYLIFMLSFHRIPRHFFIYVFLCAFLPGALLIALKMALLGGYYAFDDIYTWDVVKDNYVILIPLLLFPEALLNGMTMTLLIIYKPDWVYTFHDKFYLDKQ
ncbi:hypothetical protein CA267_001185 [Alteromonas pelagimontana]|uniref:Energy-coupling factor ABC transporter permease n=1 Tax=Alteromonas pelagimontana TaxID=1858656 RepID=A0A6M4M8G0_9ALTE|nr:energy-coupling factor ABC transporter permease [Alteromonas pelagimontana]QJR79504.1 hypothetical protein CA267_001185 [Alteromonas pelagimontana]